MRSVVRSHVTLTVLLPRRPQSAGKDGCERSRGLVAACASRSMSLTRLGKEAGHRTDCHLGLQGRSSINIAPIFVPPDPVHGLTTKSSDQPAGAVPEAHLARFIADHRPRGLSVLPPVAAR